MEKVGKEGIITVAVSNFVFVCELMTKPLPRLSKILKLSGRKYVRERVGSGRRNEAS